MTPRDKKIIEDSEREGIPIFVFTAKDILSAQAIQDYILHCRAKGCNEAHTDGVYDRLLEFQEWQGANPGKVKLPD